MGKDSTAGRIIIDDGPARWRAVVAMLLVTTICVGCDRPGRGSGSSGRSRQRKANPSAVFLQSISAKLNGLAEAVELNLTPEEKVLDASNSTDRNEILATCTPNPAVPDGPCNYMQLPRVNADFVELGVRPGDIVRYYVNVDQESAERGFEERSYFSLIVRRLSEVNPRTALIVEGGLAAPVLYPERMEIWRYSDKRMNAIRAVIERYVNVRRPRVGWEPSPDRGALSQLVERANGWFRSQELAPEWSSPELLQTLPKELREAPGVTDALAGLSEGPFQDFEGRMLQQAVWMRDIAMWAKGVAVTDRNVVRNLFDWTVRNIQLEVAEAAPYIRQPWQALLYGRGTAVMRGWIFVELCRQAQLPAVLLAVTDDQDDAAQFWVAAAVVDGQLHLFDPRLGLPLPGEDPATTATLADVVANPQRLDQLDVETPGGENLPYPIEADQLAHIEAWVVADPLQMSRRAHLLEEALQGEAFVRLSVDVQGVASQLAEHPQIADVKLWPGPFTAIIDRRTVGKSTRQQAALAFAPFASHPLLWKARALHFQGYKPPPVSQRGSALATPRDGHRDATRAYQDKELRPRDEQLREMEPTRRMIDVAAKQHASYWLGLLLYDQQSYEVAIRWLDDRTLEAYPTGPWRHGARYNLARAHEAVGRKEQAVELLKAESDDAPQRHGNLLRARRLEQSGGEESLE